MPATAYALKPCTICQTEKPLDEFPKDKSRPDGRMSRCRTCDNARSMRYYHSKVGREVRAYRKQTQPRPAPVDPTCRRCGAAYTRWRGQRYCSSKCRQATRAEAERARSAHKQSVRRTVKRYTDISPHDERRIRRAKRCALCACYLTQAEGPRKGHLDHIIPITAGGTHTHGNVRMLCRTCNLTRPKDGSDVVIPATLWAQDISAVPLRGRGAPRPRTHLRAS